MPTLMRPQSYAKQWWRIPNFCNIFWKGSRRWSFRPHDFSMFYLSLLDSPGSCSMIIGIAWSEWLPALISSLGKLRSVEDSVFVLLCKIRAKKNVKLRHQNNYKFCENVTKFLRHHPLIFFKLLSSV